MLLKDKETSSGAELIGRTPRVAQVQTQHGSENVCRGRCVCGFAGGHGPWGFSADPDTCV